jgi:hypothetical protein
MKVAPRRQSSRAALLRQRRTSTEPAGPHAISAIRPEKIPVPVDFSAESAKALDYASAPATRSGAAITLLHVVEPIHYVFDYGYGPVTRERPNETVIKSLRAHLRKLARRHLADNPYDAVVRSGTAFNQITAAAKGIGRGYDPHAYARFDRLQRRTFRQHRRTGRAARSLPRAHPQKTGTQSNSQTVKALS